MLRKLILIVILMIIPSVIIKSQISINPTDILKFREELYIPKCNDYSKCQMCFDIIKISDFSKFSQNELIWKNHITDISRTKDFTNKVNNFEMVNRVIQQQNVITGYNTKQAGYSFKCEGTFGYDEKYAWCIYNDGVNATRLFNHTYSKITEKNIINYFETEQDLASPIIMLQNVTSYNLITANEIKSSIINMPMMGNTTICLRGNMQSGQIVDVYPEIFGHQHKEHAIWYGEEIYDDFEDGVINASRWATGTNGDCYYYDKMWVIERNGNLELFANCSAPGKNNFAYVVGQENLSDFISYNISIFANDTKATGGNSDSLKFFITNTTTAHYADQAAGDTTIFYLPEDGFQTGFSDSHLYLVFNKTNQSVKVYFNTLLNGTYDLSALNHKWLLGMHVHSRWSTVSPFGNGNHLLLVHSIGQIIEYITVPYITNVPVNYSTTNTSLAWNVTLSEVGNISGTYTKYPEEYAEIIYDDFEDSVINASRWANDTDGNCASSDAMWVKEQNGNLELFANCSAPGKNNFAYVVGQENLSNFLSYNISIFANDTKRIGGNADSLRIFITNVTTAHYAGQQAGDTTIFYLPEDGFQTGFSDSHLYLVFNKTNQSVNVYFNTSLNGTYDLSALQYKWFLGVQVHSRYSTVAPTGDGKHLLLVHSIGQILRLGGTFSNASFSTLFKFNFSGLINNTIYNFNITSMCDPLNNCNTTGYNFSFKTAQNLIPPCACPGLNQNWEINMGDYCNITTDCDIGTGILNFTGIGQTRCNATINAGIFKEPGNASRTLLIDSNCFINVTA